MLLDEPPVRIEDDPGRAAAAGRRRARGPLRVRTAGRGAVRARPPGCRAPHAHPDGVGEGRQAAPGAVGPAGRGRAGRLAAPRPPGLPGRRRAGSRAGGRAAGGRRLPQPAAATARRRGTSGGSWTGERSRRRTRTPCGTASPPTCSTGVPTSGSSRSSWATPTWRPRRSTPTSARSGSSRSTARPTPAPDRRAPPGRDASAEGQPSQSQPPLHVRSAPSPPRAPADPLRCACPCARRSTSGPPRLGSAARTRRGMARSRTPRPPATVSSRRPPPDLDDPRRRRARSSHPLAAGRARGRGRPAPGHRDPGGGVALPVAAGRGPRVRAVPGSGVHVVPRPPWPPVRDRPGDGRPLRRPGDGHLRGSGGGDRVGHGRPRRRCPHQLRPAAPGAGAARSGGLGRRWRSGRRSGRSTSGSGSAGSTWTLRRSWASRSTWCLAWYPCRVASRHRRRCAVRLAGPGPVSANLVGRPGSVRADHDALGPSLRSLVRTWSGGCRAGCWQPQRRRPSWPSSRCGSCSKLACTSGTRPGVGTRR